MFYVHAHTHITCILVGSIVGVVGGSVVGVVGGVVGGSVVGVVGGVAGGSVVGVVQMVVDFVMGSTMANGKEVHNSGN